MRALQLHGHRCYAKDQLDRSFHVPESYIMAKHLDEFAANPSRGIYIM